MAECEILSICTFFNDKMSNMPVTAEMIKRKMCKGNYAECAIYLVYKAVGKENVPGNLIPHQIDRVEEIINMVKTAETS